MRLKFLFAIIGVAVSSSLHAQKASVSTNLLEWACLGTFNAEVSYAVSRHWSLMAGARFNPFTYNEGDAQRQFQYRQQSYSVGARLWPWHIWSGWWFASRLRYQEYNCGGIVSRRTSQGDRVGLGLYTGYTYMLSRHLNVEFGLGVWGGYDVYESYSCPVCGLMLEHGRRFFMLPDDVMISFVYVF